MAGFDFIAFEAEFRADPTLRAHLDRLREHREEPHDFTDCLACEIAEQVCRSAVADRDHARARAAYEATHAKQLAADARKHEESRREALKREAEHGAQHRKGRPRVP